MCNIEAGRELAERVLNRVSADEDAKALVRLLSYAAEEAVALKAGLTHSLILAGIEAISLEYASSTRPADSLPKLM